MQRLAAFKTLKDAVLQVMQTVGELHVAQEYKHPVQTPLTSKYGATHGQRLVELRARFNVALHDVQVVALVQV